MTSDPAPLSSIDLLADVDEAVACLARHGVALLSAQGLANACGITGQQLAALSASWNDLALDRHLRDGGRYRSRRHGSYVVPSSTGQPIAVPHRAHWQPVEYNALHGGMHRWFEPIDPAVQASAAWTGLISALSMIFSRVRQVRQWFVEAHQFRIDTAGGIGRPTPEGAHRDGVDFVAVVLVDRHRVRGGETRLFQTQGQSGIRFTMSEPWSVLLLDDARIVHETTPIQPDGGPGYRDTLVVTAREQGFLDPPA
jgi:hypothetical protein